MSRYTVLFLAALISGVALYMWRGTQPYVEGGETTVADARRLGWLIGALVTALLFLAVIATLR